MDNYVKYVVDCLLTVYLALTEEEKGTMTFKEWYLCTINGIYLEDTIEVAFHTRIDLLINSEPYCLM